MTNEYQSTTENQLTKEAAARLAKREYMKVWRENNRDKMRAAQRKWRNKPENKVKIKEAQRDYWSRKAAEMNHEG